MSTEMSGEEKTFLRGIARYPDDMVRRGGYADWLIEHGREDQGEFVLLQLEIFRLLAAGGTRPVSLNREQVLFKNWHNWDHGYDWPFGALTHAEWLTRGGLFGPMLSEIPDIAGGQPMTYDTMGVRNGLAWAIRSTFQHLTSSLTEYAEFAPIEFVIPYDKRPYRWSPDAGASSFGMADVYSWISDARLASHGGPEATLPDRLITKLTANGAAAGQMGMSARFDSEMEAYAGLSRVLIDDARMELEFMDPNPGVPHGQD